ncbi:hypothetical protein [Streptomyces sp. ISL-63]|uniref:hypothetical protein n=1 Tax=unclassified Streptomyces TaxID=2593676 RepID=UPI0035ABC49F
MAPVPFEDQCPARHLRTPDLTGAGGGFGWRMVNHLARTTAVTHQPSGGKTVSAFIAR